MSVGEERLPLCPVQAAGPVGVTPPPSCSMPPQTVRQAGQHSTQLRYVTSRPEPKAVVTAEATTEAAHSFATEAAVGMQYSNLTYA